MQKNYSINEIFKDNFVFVNQEGECSIPVKGILRKDKMGAIHLPESKSLLNKKHALRLINSADETHDYFIKECYRDLKDLSAIG
jgi:hypothetical protein